MDNINLEDKYDYWREKWLHEDDLINQRLTWLLASQTLLFAAYGLALQVGTNSRKASEISDKTAEVLSLIPYIGLYSSISILISVLAAVIALFVLLCKSGEKFRNHLPVTLPTTFMGVAAGVSLPVIFVFAWFSLIN